MTLRERVMALRTGQIALRDIQIDTARARRRFERWRSQQPFNTDSHFAERLASDGINEDEFLSLLGASIENIRKPFAIAPEWSLAIDRAYSGHTCSTEIPIPAQNQSIAQSHDGFLHAIEPVICQSRDRLREGIESLKRNHSNPPFDPNVVEELLLRKLRPQLSRIVNRTLVLELNVARLRGLLQGETSEDRFQSFLKQIRQRDTATALLQEYPVLARQLMICVNNWVGFSLEFLDRLCADWEAIQSAFASGIETGPLVEIKSNAGDKHRGGRSVAIARFDSGFQIVYKPRPLAADAHFQELLNWLNNSGSHPQFRLLKILDRGRYGWTEFITPQSCGSSEEVARFYERQGGYLALLYAMEATDFHYENLIAAGEHPVLVDLESLFQPHLEKGEVTQADLLAGNAMSYSVLRVLLLPMRIWSGDESAGIDLSGLGAATGQPTPNLVPYWENSGTDEMRLARKRSIFPGSNNRPSLNGEQVDVLDHTESIINGFATVYRLILEHRDELLSDEGPLARFADDEVRVLLRSTRSYATLLFESFHPDVLRDALNRDRLFDQLWAAVTDQHHLARVIAAEREDLHNGDIPFFTSNPNSRAIWTASKKAIPDFFDLSGIECVQRRLEQLSETDLTLQVWFIRASLITLSLHDAKPARYSLIEPERVADRDQMLDEARAIGDRLDWLALRGERDLTWIGLTATREGYWSLAPLGWDLYGGLPGVALFLAYLGAFTSEQHYTDMARAALETLRHQIEVARSLIKMTGGYNGWGGIIHLLTHLSALWEAPELLDEASRIVELLPPLIEQDEQYDIIGGAAGCIVSLISLYQCKPSARTLAVAVECGERLIAEAQPAGCGIGWSIKGLATKPLTGFSHGSAGIAWALLELSALSGEDKFRKAALDAIEYERSLFNPEDGNWPDLRDEIAGQKKDSNSKPSFMTAWCHGAPGVGLARLLSSRHFEDQTINAEIDAALKTTLARGFGLNHCLCHGDLGNLELLLQAKELFGGAEWEYEVRRISSIILESIRRNGLLSGLPMGVESPGLMTGLAGIGYGLLRLAHPESVPSVLALAPPAMAGKGVTRRK